MNSPLKRHLSIPAGILSGSIALFLFPALLLSLSGCGGSLVNETVAEPKVERALPPPPTVPMWLGNPSRNFYGTGPWSDRPSEILWEFETELITGRQHKEGWGGSSWPGQPSVVG